MIEQSCGKCRYWEKSSDVDYKGVGICRRYAPRSFIWHSQRGDGFGYPPEAVWPLTDDFEWCGEWDAKP